MKYRPTPNDDDIQAELFTEEGQPIAAIYTDSPVKPMQFLAAFSALKIAPAARESLLYIRDQINSVKPGEVISIQITHEAAEQILKLAENF